MGIRKSDPAFPKERIQVIFSFFLIYFVWGTTYLAIRVVVADLPPFFSAAVRFLIAGAILLAVAAIQGSMRLEGRQILNAALIASLMFLIGYGGLFWSERLIDSGIASVLVATIPVWIALTDAVILRSRRLSPPILLSLVMGLAGVALLTTHTGPVNIPILPVVVLTLGQASWALGTVLSGRLELPKSRILTAGLEMFTGGALLAAASLLAGEMHQVHRISFQAGLALLYLAIPGSVLAFTAYVWLLRRVSSGVVGSYAYVNPVVALTVGHIFGNEEIGPRAIAGSALIVGCVIVSLSWGDASYK